MKKNKTMYESLSVVITAESGEKLKSLDDILFVDSPINENIIEIFPNRKRQTILGIGTSFTEASAFVLAQLNEDLREQVMLDIFSEKGANFAMARTHMGSCDFCVEGKYSYAPVEDDVELKHFSIAPDIDGFSKEKYPLIRDQNFDLLPMIKQALTIKSQQQDSQLNIIASPWTAPAWMKDIKQWFIKGSKQNNFQGTGGVLEEKYAQSFANYFVKYLQAYQQQGVDIWGITPVNEPYGNNGQWESMQFSAETQNEFIKNHLGPALEQSAFSDKKLLIFDHNRTGLKRWADCIYADKETSPYVSGAAIHWYESTFKVFEDELEHTYQSYPDKLLVHTEGCIDDLGNPAPPGIADPVAYQESNWFDNDDFWWNDNATDWAYTANWPGVVVEDHPIYTPVHRYARNIIVSFNHWLHAWIDWNIVLDQRGGPNHVGNYCGAPIMIDTKHQYVYYTPVFYILAQLSRSMRPGDVILETQTAPALQNEVYACASINGEGGINIQLLNTAREQIEVSLKMGKRYAHISLPANALLTLTTYLNNKLN